MSIEKFISGCKKKQDLFEVWKVPFLMPPRYRLSVLILNAPCMGFGDIVFAMKFCKFLEEWYGCRVGIATTQKKSFISLGQDPDTIYDFESTSKSKNCRKFSRLEFWYKGVRVECPKADIVFIAPLTADFEPDRRDVKKIVPWSNEFNTFFLSEYNDSLKKKIDFHTGVGKGRYGMFFTNPETGPFPAKLKHAYSVIYVAESLARVKRCIFGFAQLVGKKYSGDNFEIVVPGWADLDSLVSAVSPYFKKIVIREKDKQDRIEDGKETKKNTVYIRADIFPLSNKEMLALIQHSVKDILLTGDQSITDALSCCVDKNIFYQIAPWKEEFAKNLEKQLPNRWLKYKSKSCGNLRAIRYKSNYKKFKAKWDFRVLAKQKMDGIFGFIAEKNYGDYSDILNQYVDTVLASRTYKSFIKKWRGNIK